MDGRWSFCSDHRKALAESQTCLIAKDGFCSCSGSVAFLSTVLQDVPHQVQVSVHAFTQQQPAEEALRRCSLTCGKIGQKEQIACVARVERVGHDRLAGNFVKQKSR